MSSWGKNDRSSGASANVQFSNGAPIGISTAVKLGGGANSSKANTAGSRANVEIQMFSNATPGAFLPGQAVGVFGVSATEMANNKINKRETGGHAGWNLRRAGTGPIVSIVLTGATASAYNNNSIINIRSQQAGGNATIAMTTNATGGNLSFTIVNPGAGFVGNGAMGNTTIPTSNISITNSTGGTATGNATATFLVVRAGGRAGRVHTETLVAMGSLGAQTAAFGTPASVNDATTDNTFYPGV
jgi:hypothetical protein